jgi:N-acetylmuramoyl-L-alanine amidase
MMARRYILLPVVTLFLLVSSPPTQADPGKNKVRTIVIDPGHGGKDPGCVAHGVMEKDIVLDVALLLRDRIRQIYPDIVVLLTREEDVFIPLHERTQIANQAKADLFISLHCNAIDNVQIHGSETYVLGLHRAEANLAVAMRENEAILLEDNFQLNYGDFDPNSSEAYILMSLYQNAYLEKSIVLAGLLEEEMHKTAGRKSKGVKQAGFLVLRENAMPSILFEAGYLTNKEERAFLASQEGKSQVVESLLQAIRRFKHKIEQTPEVFVSAPPPPSSAPSQVKAAPVVAPSPEASPKTKTTAPVQRWYGVQVGAFSKPLSPDHPLRKEAAPLREMREGGLFKYLSGPYDTRAAAEQKLRQLQQSGQKGIFVAAYDGDTRVVDP